MSVQESQVKKTRGRPVSKNPKSERLELRLTPELKEQLQTMADARGISMAALINLLLTEFADCEHRPLLNKID